MNKKGTIKLNRKGFTLVELLATIAILAIVGGIATYGVINTINTSKLKSEEIFINKLSTLIDDYLDLNPPTKKLTPTYSFDKCKEYEKEDDTYICSESDEVTVTQMNNTDNAGNPVSVYISNLVEEGIVAYTDLINPKNKEQCFNATTNPEIFIYKDSDYVYYYYVDLSTNNCDITDENAIINTLPDNLKSEVGLS